MYNTLMPSDDERIWPEPTEQQARDLQLQHAVKTLDETIRQSMSNLVHLLRLTEANGEPTCVLERGITHLRESRNRLVEHCLLSAHGSWIEFPDPACPACADLREPEMVRPRPKSADHSPLCPFRMTS